MIEIDVHKTYITYAFIKHFLKLTCKQIITRNYTLILWKLSYQSNCSGMMILDAKIHSIYLLPWSDIGKNRPGITGDCLGSRVFAVHFT